MDATQDENYLKLARPPDYLATVSSKPHTGDIADPNPRCLMETLARKLLAAVGKWKLSTIRWWGRLIGTAVYLLAPKGRQQTIDNLDRIYGDSLSRKEKVRIAKGSFVNIATLVMEIGYLFRVEGSIKPYFHCEGFENMVEGFNKGRGLIILVPHMGNWEIPARITAEMFPVINAVTRRQRPAWLASIICDFRAFNKMNEIDNKNSLRSALRALRRGEVVYMLIDRHIRRGTIVGNFLGHPAQTSAAPALLAMRTGCSVVVACSWRHPSGKFAATVSKPVETIVTGDRDRDLLTNTQRYLDITSDYVRTHPEDWMWMHRCWRIKPPSGDGEESSD